MPHGGASNEFQHFHGEIRKIQSTLLSITSGIKLHIHLKDVVVLLFPQFCKSGPSCSKQTKSLVNDSLKFTSSDTQIC